MGCHPLMDFHFTMIPKNTQDKVNKRPCPVPGQKQSVCASNGRLKMSKIIE